VLNRSIVILGLFVSVSAFGRQAILVKLQGPPISSQNQSDSYLCSAALLGFDIGSLFNSDPFPETNYLLRLNADQILTKSGEVSGSFDQKTGAFESESKNSIIRGNLDQPVGHQTFLYKNSLGQTICKISFERSIQTRIIEIK
jgi:hypothetical protein